MTERLKIYKRNYLYSKQVVRERIRNLDRAFICPLYPKFSYRLIISSEDIKASNSEDKAKDSSNFDTTYLRKIVINNSIANLYLEARYKNRDILINKI